MISIVITWQREKMKPITEAIWKCILQGESVASAKRLDRTPETDEEVGDRVCRFGRLSFSEQQQIAQLSEQQLYEYIFNEPKVYAKGKIDPEKGGWVIGTRRKGLGLLAQLETPAIRSLENRIVLALQNAVPMSQYDEFVRKDRSPYLWRVTWSDGRRYIRRDEHEPAPSEELDLKYNKYKYGRRIGAKLELPQVSGQKFFAIPVNEPFYFYGWHPNEIKHISPAGANAYEVGEGAFLREVSQEGNFLSPLIIRKILKNAVPKLCRVPEFCSYVIAPIKFYNIPLEIALFVI